MTKRHHIEMAQRMFLWGQHHPNENWEKRMYYELFLWAGYKQ
jgi:hypothetical protein